MKKYRVSSRYRDILDQNELVSLGVGEGDIILRSKFYKGCNVDPPEAGKAGQSRSDIEDVLTIYEDLQLPSAFVWALGSEGLEGQLDSLTRWGNCDCSCSLIAGVCTVTAVGRGDGKLSSCRGRYVHEAGRLRVGVAATVR
jgi:hypothetical protein